MKERLPFFVLIRNVFLCVFLATLIGCASTVPDLLHDDVQLETTSTTPSVVQANVTQAMRDFQGIAVQGSNKPNLSALMNRTGNAFNYNQGHVGTHSGASYGQRNTTRTVTVTLHPGPYTVTFMYSNHLRTGQTGQSRLVDVILTRFVSAREVAGGKVEIRSTSSSLVTEELWHIIQLVDGSSRPVIRDRALGKYRDVHSLVGLTTIRPGSRVTLNADNEPDYPCGPCGCNGGECGSPPPPPPVDCREECADEIRNAEIAYYELQQSRRDRNSAATVFLSTGGGVAACRFRLIPSLRRYCAVGGILALPRMGHNAFNSALTHGDVIRWERSERGRARDCLTRCERSNGNGGQARVCQALIS